MKPINSNYISYEEALDRFFSRNPENPFLALVLLYLRKCHRLSDGIPYFDNLSDTNEDGRLCEILKIFERETRPKGEAGTTSDSVMQTYWSDFASSLIQLEENWLQENFNELFDKTVQRCFKLSKYYQYSQPHELNRLIAYFLDDKFHRVYAPFAGVASDALAIPQNAVYIGEEKDPLFAAVGNLRLLANGIEGEIAVTSSINDDVYDADVIVSTPPFVVRVNTESLEVIEKYGRKIDMVGFLLKKSILHKKAAIITVSAYFNTGITCGEIRKSLVENDMLDTVISLPTGIFESVNIKTCLYVIDPDHKHKGSVRFIDASDLFSGNSRFRTLAADEVVSLVTNNMDGKSVMADIEKIRKNDYVLTPQLYVEPATLFPEGCQMLPLCELVDFVSFPPFAGTATGSKAYIVDLINKDNFNRTKTYLPKSDFPFREIKIGYKEVKDECILVPSLISKWRAIIVDPDGQRLFAPSMWHQLVIKDKKLILPQYLALQFYQPYFEYQIMDSRMNIPRSLLRRVMVAVPSIHQQEKEVELYRDNLMASMGLELSSDIARVEDRFKKEMNLRRHSLSNKLTALSNRIGLLERFITRQEGPFEKTAVVGHKSGTTLEENIHALADNLKVLQEMVFNLTKVNDAQQPETINIFDFCETYIEGKRQEHEGYVIALSDYSPVSDMTEPSAINIRIGRKDLESVFDNIVKNARIHGFTDLDDPIDDDMKRKDFVILIEIERFDDENGTDLAVLRFLNNGRPLKTGMSPEDVFKWGRSSGKGFNSGIGGYHVREIIESAGGSVDFQSLVDDQRGYTVAYEIRLPIVSNQEEYKS